jgi:hypothetical protein
MHTWVGKQAGRQRMLWTMRCCGPEKSRICASDKCRRTLAAAGWLRRAAVGIRPVFSALAWRREPERLAKLLLRWLSWWISVVAGGVESLLCCFLDLSVIVDCDCRCRAQQSRRLLPATSQHGHSLYRDPLEPMTISLLTFSIYCPPSGIKEGLVFLIMCLRIPPSSTWSYVITTAIGRR